jgi:hypothetical protein
MMHSLKTLATQPLLLRRALCALVIVGAVAAMVTLSTLHDRASARSREAAAALAWRSTITAPAATPNALAVYSRFNINTAANADLTWQSASAAELRASLRALDDAQVKLAQVKVKRSGSNFVVNAERAP